VVIVIGVLLVFTRSRFGLQVRAVVANADLAEVVGLQTRRVNLLAFGIGAATAGTAGALVAPLGSVSPQMGFPYLAGAFLVVIAGGVRRMWGVLIGAIIIAAVQTGVIHYFDAVWGQIAVLGLAVVILEMRREQPSGRAIA
jgi:urea transport system permease protein